jgi:PD-(D/E)XK endonuclease
VTRSPIGVTRSGFRSDFVVRRVLYPENVNLDLSTDQKGAIAESAIVHAAIKLGIGVFRPLSDGERYDLIFNLRPRLVRVQCKTAVLLGDVLAVPFYSNRRGASGFVKRVYTSDEIDAVAAYSPELERCFFLPMDEFGTRTYVQLRLAPSKNNQRRRINWADDYEFERLQSEISGAVAQLGERRDGIAEARGSSPLGSIETGYGARASPRPTLSARRR